MRQMLFAVVLFLMGCQPMFASPSSPVVVQNTPLPASSEVIFTFSRQGGIAGFCDEVILYADGRAVISSCRGKHIEKKLSPQEFQQMSDWMKRFAPFEFTYSDPQAVADGMSISWSFRGRGTHPVDAATQEQMQEFLSGLMRALYQP